MKKTEDAIDSAVNSIRKFMAEELGKIDESFDRHEKFDVGINILANIITTCFVATILKFEKHSNILGYVGWYAHIQECIQASVLDLTEERVKKEKDSCNLKAN